VLLLRRIALGAFMPQIQYKSMDEINSSPAALLDFAHTLKTTYEASSDKMSLQSFLTKEVSVAGAPMSMAKQMMHLSNKDFDLDDLQPNQVMQLHKANTILRGMEKSWDISDHMSDPRLGEKLEELKKLNPVEGLANRVTGTLVPREEHTVSTGLHP
jgi:hypothetical protein